jgi:hypothetical protein
VKRVFPLSPRNVSFPVDSHALTYTMKAAGSRAASPIEWEDVRYKRAWCTPGDHISVSVKPVQPSEARATLIAGQLMCGAAEKLHLPGGQVQDVAVGVGEPDGL